MQLTCLIVFAIMLTTRLAAFIGPLLFGIVASYDETALYSGIYYYTALSLLFSLSTNVACYLPVPFIRVDHNNCINADSAILRNDSAIFVYSCTCINLFASHAHEH